MPASVSRAVVRIHAELFGRGATRARTIMGPDLITVVLEDLFTPAERTLIGADKFEQVRATRLAFQDQVEPLFRQAIEQLTGRTVRGFLSQVSEQNFGAEVFVLEPRESVNDA